MRASASGSVHLFQDDLSILDSKEKRADLACKVEPLPAALGFNFKFETGYDVVVTLDGIDGDLTYTVIARVTNLDAPSAEPVHFRQRILVNAPPEKVEDRKVYARFAGYLNVGRGNYQIDWLLRDSAGYVCADFWKIEARLSDKHRHVRLQIPPGEVESAEADRAAAAATAAAGSSQGLPGGEAGAAANAPFPPPAAHQPADVLPVKLLINYSAGDGPALLEMFRAISRDPRIGDISLVLFNLDQRRILLEQSGTTQVDFAQIETALQDFTPGVVDYKVLSKQDGGFDPFLAKLVHSDDARATIFIGPANPTMMDGKVKADWEVPPHVFYLRYQPDPLEPAWNDVIDRVVRESEGRRYSIQDPKDLLKAWSDIMSRMTAEQPQSR